MPPESPSNPLQTLLLRRSAAVQPADGPEALAPVLLDTLLEALPLLDELALYVEQPDAAHQVQRSGPATVLPRRLPVPITPGEDDPQTRILPLTGAAPFGALVVHATTPLEAHHHALLDRAVEVITLALSRVTAGQVTLQALFQAMNDVVLVLDGEGRYLQIAPTNPSLLFKPPQEMLGKLTTEVLPPAAAGTITTAITTALEQNTVVEIEYGLTLEGMEYWFAATVSPLTAERVMLVARDITAYRQLLAQVEASLAQRSRQVQTLNEVYQDLVNIPRLEDLFARVVTLVKERLGYAHAQIFRYDPELQAMRLVVGYGEVGARMLAAGHRLPLERGVVGTAAATGKPVLASNVTHDPTWVPHPDLPATRGELAVPITLRGEVLGILDVQSNTAGALTSDDQLLLESLTGGIATVLQSNRLLEAQQRAAEETALLYATSSQMVDAKRLEDILHALIQPVASQGLTQAQLFLLRGAPTWAHPSARAEVAAAWSDGTLPDLTGMSFTADQFPNWSDLATPTVLAVDDLDTDERISPEARLGYSVQGLHSVTLLPLEVGGQPVGAVQLGYSARHTHTERELRLYHSLADLATVALRNIELLEQARHRALQLQTSAEVSRAATSILEIGALLPRVVNLIRDSFGYDHVQVFLVDEAGEQAVLQASTGEAGATMLRLKWTLAVGSNSVIGQVTQGAEPVIALDTADAKVAHRPNPYLPDTRSEMAIPLATRGRVVGALDVQSRQPNAFDEEDVRVLSLLADQIAVALDNARLFQQTQNYTQTLSTQVMSLQMMLEASQRFNTILDAREILQVAAEQIVTLLHADHAGILVAQPQTPGLGVLVADYPPVPEIAGVEMPIEGAWWRETYAETQQPVVVQNVADSPLLDEDSRATLLASGINQVLIVPFITSGAQVTGSIGVDIYAGGREFTPEDLTLVQLFAAQVASAYQNALSFARTQQQAEDMRFLFTVTTAAAEAPDLDASMRTVLAQLQAAIPSAASGLYLAGTEEGLLRRVAGEAGAGELRLPEHLPLDSWVARQVMEERRPVLVPDLDAHKAQHGLPVRHLRSLAITPLLDGAAVIGLILNFERRPNAYSEANRQLLQALSGSISAVVQNTLLLDAVRAANDRLLELDRIKSQFLANMSHELRTPLNSIIGFSRLILKGIDGPLTDMQAQDLETIHSSGQHLLNLINDILDQAKIEADKLSIRVDWFDLMSMVEVAKSMSIGLLKDRAVRLNVELERGLPPVWGDEMRTRQVLINLLSNAAKFTYEGSITIMAFTVQRDDGPYIQVSVADTGIGIPASKLDSVFVAFEQVDGSLTRGSGGTGLGLPISRSLIEMMGGELWVESTVNVGSTFSFIVPTFEKAPVRQAEVAPESDLLASPAQSPYEAQAIPERQVVLVIDGEVGMHQFYRRHLGKAGFTVEATANAAQAQDVLSVTQPDVILLDVATGDGAGWTALEWLAKMEDYHPPVIVASLQPDEARASALGAVACLSKPFTPDALVKLVRRVNDQHAPRRVLIIDDKPETLRPVMALLRGQPRFALQTATSGQQGLDMIRRRRPDVILLDLYLPDLDGMALLDQLRRSPRTRHIPVIILTAEDELAAARQADLEGVLVVSKQADAEAQVLTGVQTLLSNNDAAPPHANGDPAA